MEKRNIKIQGTITPSQKQLLQYAIHQLNKYHDSWEILCKYRSSLSTMEYLYLVKDLLEFEKQVLEKKGVYELRSIVSFHASFCLIYKRLQELEQFSDVWFLVLFKDLKFNFSEWITDITSPQLKF